MPWLEDYSWSGGRSCRSHLATVKFMRERYGTANWGEADMNVKEQLLEIVKTIPGLTDVELHRELAVRTWAVQRFGIWAAMFGPTYGAMYVALQELARDGLVASIRGEAAPHEPKRRAPLRFYPRQSAPSLSEQTGGSLNRGSQS